MCLTFYNQKYADLDNDIIQISKHTDQESQLCQFISFLSSTQ